MPEFNLQTNNLILSPFSEKDSEYFFETWNDLDFRKYLFDDEFVSKELVHEQIERSKISFVEHKFGLWKLTLKKSGKPCGFSGLRYAPDMPGEIGLLYGIEKKFWGRGFALEGSREVLNFAFNELKIEKIVALANPENIPSWRILEKLGMDFSKEIETEIEKLKVYELSNEEFSNPRFS